MSEQRNKPLSAEQLRQLGIKFAQRPEEALAGLTLKDYLVTTATLASAIYTVGASIVEALSPRTSAAQSSPPPRDGEFSHSTLQKVEWQGHLIKPRHGGGFVVAKRGEPLGNPMPGAIHFTTIESAQAGIAALLLAEQTGGDFWMFMQLALHPSKEPVTPDPETSN